MTLVLALLVGVLFATGTFLVLQRSLSRMVIGFGLLAHGISLLLLSSGSSGNAPIVGSASPDSFADPLPQAMALTAIVISFGILVFLMTLAFRSWTITGNDETQDDLEDRRIAREHDAGGSELADLEAVEVDE